MVDLEKFPLKTMSKQVGHFALLGTSEQRVDHTRSAIETKSAIALFGPNQKDENDRTKNEK
jgi:hypothetical protein